MYIKHLIGARKHETEDLPFELGKAKVERGEAEDVYGVLPKPPQSVVAQPEVQSNRVDAVAMGAKKVKGGRRP